MIIRYKTFISPKEILFCLCAILLLPRSIKGTLLVPSLMNRNLCFLMSKAAEFRVRWDFSFFLCYSQAFQKEVLMDAETLLRGWWIVLVGGPDIMILIGVSLVFRMKPANIEALNSVNTCTFLAFILPEVLSLYSSPFSPCYVCSWVCVFVYLFFKEH